jgi:hypothetical protein
MYGKMMTSKNCLNKKAQTFQFTHLLSGGESRMYGKTMTLNIVQKKSPYINVRAF